MTVGVLRVRPGTDLERLRRAITAALPPDVRVLTKEGLVAREQGFWDHVAPIGTVFSIGVVMGFIVGLAICYQVLFSDISERLAEFATLKAMGYSDLRLFSIIVTQSVYLALLGYTAGLVVSLALFGVVYRATGLPMDMRLPDAAAILGPDRADVRRLGLPGRPSAGVGRPRAALPVTANWAGNPSPRPPTPPGGPQTHER